MKYVQILQIRVIFLLMGMSQGNYVAHCAGIGRLQKLTACHPVKSDSWQQAGFTAKLKNKGDSVVEIDRNSARQIVNVFSSNGSATNSKSFDEKTGLLVSEENLGFLGLKIDGAGIVDDIKNFTDGSKGQIADALFATEAAGASNPNANLIVMGKHAANDAEWRKVA